MVIPLIERQTYISYSLGLSHSFEVWAYLCPKFYDAPFLKCSILKNP